MRRVAFDALSLEWLGPPMKKVLVIGGSGYLGQFVVDELSSSYEVGCSWYVAANCGAARMCHDECRRARARPDVT